MLGLEAGGISQTLARTGTWPYAPYEAVLGSEPRSPGAAADQRSAGFVRRDSQTLGAPRSAIRKRHLARYLYKTLTCIHALRNI